MSTSTATVRMTTRDEVQRWLPQLDEWLLDGAFYGVQHTWPQLYRNDGDGMFFVVEQGGMLLSHCAGRIVTMVDEHGPQPTGLIGSVATHPDHRGRGLAGDVLCRAMETLSPHTRQLLLWAEQPGLYARLGFAPCEPESCLVLARRPRRPLADGDVVRPAIINDHATLHALHERKPRRVQRSVATMSKLMTTPGMATFVLERDGEVIAYACTGKGADLQGHWHELGGTDQAVAALLPEAMHLSEQIEAALLLPPYRHGLAELLGEQVVGAGDVPGPMRHAADDTRLACWVDGLDSV